MIRVSAWRRLNDPQKEKTEEEKHSLERLLSNISKRSEDYANPCSKLRVGSLFKLTSKGDDSKWFFLLPWDLDFPCQVKCDSIGIVEVISTSDERFKFLSEKRRGEQTEIGKIEEIH